MRARRVPSDSPALAAALSAAHLPADDLGEGNGCFFSVEEGGEIVGFGGYELYGEDVLLRSLVVLPEVRGKGLGRAVAREVLAQAHGAGALRAWLFTDTAEPFFVSQGFTRIERSQAPASILSTKQATTTCASAPLLLRPLPV